MRALARKIKRFRYSIVIREDRVEIAKVLAFVGWILIIAGLLGELRAATKIEDLSARIQSCNDARVAEVTEQAGDAAQSARTAHDEAEAVGKEADAIDKRLDVASTQLSSLATETKALKDDIAAEKEDLRRIRTARTIPQTAIFISELRPFNRTKYMFWTVAQDSDSLRLALFLNDLLHSAGWIKVPRPSDKQYDPLAMNIFQESNPPEYIPPERFTEGIRIFINSPVVAEGEQRSLASLRKAWGDNPPSSARPAEALACDLNERMDPPEHTTWGGVSDEEKSLGYRPIQVLAIQGGATDVVVISVGLKPL